MMTRLTLLPTLFLGLSLGLSSAHAATYADVQRAMDAYIPVCRELHEYTRTMQHASYYPLVRKHALRAMLQALSEAERPGVALLAASFGQQGRAQQVTLQKLMTHFTELTKQIESLLTEERVPRSADPRPLAGVCLSE